MKCCRLLCIAFISLLLIGCNAKKDILPILTKLQFTAQIDHYNENYSCFTEIDSHGDMTVEVITPEEINGMLLTFTDDGVNAQYKGITYTPKIDAMPVGNVAQIMYDIFDDISNEKAMASVNENNCEISGRISDKKYFFTFSPTGLPLTLEIPDDSFKITFKGVTIIK